jgi:hypothetical protein
VDGKEASSSSSFQDEEEVDASWAASSHPEEKEGGNLDWVWVP